MKRGQIIYIASQILLLTGGLMYVFSQLDIIPDGITLFGFLDDAGVIVLLFLLYQRIRKKYHKMGKKR